MFIDELGPLPEEELHFKTEWFDSNACISRKYILTCYYNSNNVVEAAKIYEIEKKRIFLKKTRIPEIDVHSLKEGSSVSIFSRIFNIKSYSDDITRHVVMGYKKIGLVFQSLTDISEIIEFEKNATIDSISIGYLPLNVNPILNFDSTKLFIIVIGSRDQPTTADETDYITDPKTISHLESVELKMHHQKENVAIVILTNTLLKAKKTNIALTEIHNQLEIVCAKTMQLTREEAMTYLEIYAGVLPNITALVNALCGKECVIM